MKPNSTVEHEINNIRLAIYEETKGMTPEERVAHTRAAVAPIIQQYGFKVVSGANSHPDEI